MVSPKGNTILMIEEGQIYICTFDIDLGLCCFGLRLFCLGFFSQCCGFTKADILKIMVYKENPKVQFFLLPIWLFLSHVGLETVKNTDFYCSLSHFFRTNTFIFHYVYIKVYLLSH